RRLVVADGVHRPPHPRAQQEVHHEKRQDRPAQRQEVQPLVGGEPRPPGRRRLLQRQPHRPAGHRLEPLQQRDQEDRDRERDQRQIQPPQPRRGHPERVPDHERRRGRQRQRQRIRQPPVVHHHGGPVRADREERPVPQRDLPGVTGQQVQADQRDRVHHDHRQLEHPERDHLERRRHRQQQQRPQREHPPVPPDER